MKHTLSILLTMWVGMAAWAQEEQLRLSEILFNPKPEGADYVEIYNPGPLPVSLRNVRLAQWKNDAVSKLYLIDTNYTMGVDEFLVLTTDAGYVRRNYQGRHNEWLKEVASMPGYNDASGTLLLTLSDTTPLERFDYREDMHNALISNVEGVSLERRSYEHGPNVANNWQSAASTAGYGTPTGANSQSTEFLFLEDQFELSAEVISPDGDGNDDVLDITYQLSSENLSANINIYDGYGRRVRHLLRGGLLGSHGIVTWEGDDDNGARCRQGNYIIHIEAYTPAGQKQVSKRVVALIMK